MKRNFTKVIASTVLAIIVSLSSVKAASYNEYKNIRDIKVSGNADVYLVQGLVESVKISDQVSDAVVAFKDGKLNIENYSKNKATIFIYVTQLKNFEAEGAINIYSVNKINSLDLNFNLKGTSTAKVDVNTLNLDSKLSDASNLLLTGFSENFNTKINDASKVNIAGLKVDTNSFELGKKYLSMIP